MGVLQDLKDIANEPFDPAIQKMINDINSEMQDSDEPEQKGKKSQADILTEIIEGLNIDLFHDETMQSYGSIFINDHFETWALTSKQFKIFCKQAYFLQTGKNIKMEIVKQVVELLEARATFDGEKIELQNRVAESEGAFILDLADKNWRAVKTTSKGWDIIEAPTLFKRYSHQEGNVEPIGGGDINRIFNYINLKQEQKLLYLVYLISLFVPKIPHPILLTSGEKGSGKTSFFRIIKKIIDPSIIETTSFPKQENELIQKLQHHYFIGFDNISFISNSTSDILCRAVTDLGFSKRTLYENDDDFIYKMRRCIGLNGINVVASQDDLLDRCVMLELKRIDPEHRQEEAELWREFESDRPHILGAIFDILSKGMAIYPSVKLGELYRLADFTRWGYAIAEAIEQGQGQEFLKAYSENIDRQNEELINSNPVAQTVVEFMKDKNSFMGTPSTLFAELETTGYRLHLDIKGKSFPKSPDGLSKTLKRIKSNLFSAGILSETTKTGGIRYISLTKTGESEPEFLAICGEPSPF